MEIESCVPPGFRFHPTDEELVGYYLRRKVNSLNIDLDVIADIDLYRMEPWDIQGWVVCRAFKKPSPNHKPNYGAWNHAYYLRDNNVNFGGFPSTSEAAVPKQMNFPDAVSVFCRPPPFDSSDQDLDHEFPGLQESATTLSPSLATKCGGGINRDWKDERSDQGGEYVDWQEFDNLLAAELDEPAAAFPHSNFPLVSQEYETNIAQSHANYPFTCFPEF
ncbi:hypothetical protein U1Q18_036976 [Sarracenia purpurea var. burkii]